MFLLLSTLTMAADQGEVLRPALPYYQTLPVEEHELARKHHRSAVAWSSVTGVLAVGMVSSNLVGGLFSYPWIVAGTAAMGTNVGTALSARRYARTVGLPARLGTAAVVCAGASLILLPLAAFAPKEWSNRDLMWGGMFLGAVAVLPLSLLQGHVASRSVWEGQGASSPWLWADLRVSLVPSRDGGLLVASAQF